MSVDEGHSEGLSGAQWGLSGGQWHSGSVAIVG